MVTKNMPFNCPEEDFLKLFLLLGLVSPSAHNNQFGALIGVAFANFHGPLDAQAVVNKLNNFMMNGRCLSAELIKKLSPEEERVRQLKRRFEQCQQLHRTYDICPIDCTGLDTIDLKVKHGLSLGNKQLLLL